MIWTAAAAHWTPHQYRVAVREASEALTVHWKERLGRNDVTDTSFWQQTPLRETRILACPISPGPVRRRTRRQRACAEVWHRCPQRSTNLATGLNLAVRNVATHARDELIEQEGMERLAACSYLARLLDQCEIRRAKERKTRESFPSAEPVRRAGRCPYRSAPKALGMAMKPAELEVRKDTLELLDNGDPAGGSPRPSACRGDVQRRAAEPVSMAYAEVSRRSLAIVDGLSVARYTLWLTRDSSESGRFAVRWRKKWP
ncbi:TIGR02391 family protein [Streptomyces kanasensis]|uniref:TIGR02391 family protein n=1 Tax=Streptomyces kanasensis TaxID=936756 RepID=UPI00382BC879